MSDTRDTSDGVTVGERLASLHAQIVTEDVPDERFHVPISNRDKVAFVCALLKQKPETFDLCEAWPLDDWLDSQDGALLRAGIYVTNLRQQYFGLLLKGDAVDLPENVWHLQARAEFDFNAFNSRIYRRSSGDLMPEIRVLN